MKRCPECNFIHEDDERLCAMDGAELVNHSGPLPFDDSVLPQLMAPRNSHGRSLTLVAAAVILAIAVFLNFRNVTKRNAFQSNLQGNVYIGPRPGGKQPTINVPVVTSTPVSLESPSSSPARPKMRSSTRDHSDSPSDRDPFRAVPLPPPTPSFRPLPSYSPARATTSAPSDNSVSSTAKRNNVTTELRAPVTPEKRANTAVANQKKETRVNSFLKKTARVLKKPFNH